MSRWRLELRGLLRCSAEKQTVRGNSSCFGQNAAGVSGELTDRRLSQKRHGVGAQSVGRHLLHSMQVVRSLLIPRWFGQTGVVPKIASGLDFRLGLARKATEL